MSLITAPLSILPSIVAVGSNLCTKPWTKAERYFYTTWFSRGVDRRILVYAPNQTRYASVTILDRLVKPADHAFILTMYNFMKGGVQPCHTSPSHLFIHCHAHGQRHFKHQFVDFSYQLIQWYWIPIGGVPSQGGAWVFPAKFLWL